MKNTIEQLLINREIEPKVFGEKKIRYINGDILKIDFDELFSHYRDWLDEIVVLHKSSEDYDMRSLDYLKKLRKAEEKGFITYGPFNFDLTHFPQR